MKSNTYAHAIRTLRTWKKKQIIIIERESNIKEEEEEAKKLPNDSVSSPKSRLTSNAFSFLDIASSHFQTKYRYSSTY